MTEQYERTFMTQTYPSPTPDEIVHLFDSLQAASGNAGEYTSYFLDSLDFEIITQGLNLLLAKALTETEKETPMPTIETAPGMYVLYDENSQPDEYQMIHYASIVSVGPTRSLQDHVETFKYNEGATHVGVYKLGPKGKLTTVVTFEETP